MPISTTKVKKIMISKGISPSDLAEKMNLSKSRISTLINKKTSTSQIKTIYSLAKALNVDSTEIIEEGEE